MSIEVMKQALDALEEIADEVFSPYENKLGNAIDNKLNDAILALSAAIEQEPVTWWHEPGAQMNYRKWQGLTDEEREQFRQWAHPDIIEAIELRLQQRNT